MTTVETDVLRRRWEGYRTPLGLTEMAGDDFALGGLGGLVEGLDARLLVLPPDPLEERLALDSDLVERVKAPRAAPFGMGAYHWSNTRVTAHAAVSYAEFGEGQWSRYLALHRHGGIELALSDASRGPRREHGPHVFFLRHLVGHIWDAFAFREQLAADSPISGPVEITLGLRNTGGSVLGHVAEGWAEPRDFMDRPFHCLEGHVLLRLEFAELPPSEDLAMLLGERIDNAWGSTSKRYLARKGDYTGRFDPRGLA